MYTTRLRKLGVGAHVAGIFMGIACFADDVILISPCRHAMDLMLREVEKFANDNNIQFSTNPDPSKSKSKCIFVVGNSKASQKPPPLTLCGRPLPWVESATHLGHELHESGNMEHDAVTKRAQFIAKSVELRTMFHWASPVETLKVLKTNLSSFYGAMLWDLGGEKARQVYSAWDTAVKLVWECPRQTRTFLLQEVLNCGYSSARSDILSRYVNFFRGLQNSASYEVRVLANLSSRDVRSTTGKNLKLLSEESSLCPRTSPAPEIKKAICSKEKVTVSNLDSWRIPYLRKLLTTFQELKHLALEDELQTVRDLINSLVI